MPGDASLVPRLAAVLAAAAEATEAAHASAPGDGPTPRELAELLWLAQRLGPVEEPAVASATAAATAPPVAPAQDTEAEVPTEQGATDVVPPTPRAPQPDPSPAAPRDGRVPLHMPAPPSAQPERAANGPSLLAPAPPMLKRPLALQRALRPLKRRVPSPHARVLDERATADRIARLGAHPDAWLPVLRPAPDRWLRLSLVHDTGPTMPVWRPLVRELHTALAQSGFFRTVTLHPATPDGRARHVPDLADGRTVTLVVSDCMGPQWRPGPAGRRWYDTLRRWALRMPLAVVQPLPERLWPTTTLPAEPGLLTAPATAAATTALAFAPYDADAPPPRDGAVLLPVLEPGPKWLAHWAGLIADPGGGRTPGAAAWLPPAPTPDTEPAPDIASLPPDDLFRHFRATASPEAFRLAGHLALAVPSVPVMRLVQHTLLRDPRPQHLAEVILSGMLTAVPGPPGSYDFRPGVRDLLMRTLPRTARGRAREFLAQVGGLIDERAGFAAGEFRARAGSHGDAPFATVSEETVQRLGGGEDQAREGTEQGLIGGRYRPVERRGPGQRMWTAVDVATDQLVALHLYREQTAPQDRFLREAQALAAIDDPHVVRVLSHGVQGEVPYLVTQFVDGVTLAELQRGSGPGVPFGLFARLASQVVPGLRALHERGLVRGQTGTAGLLLRPDGTVVISRFALGDESLSKDATSDFRELNALLRGLVRFVTAPAEYTELLAAIGNGRLTAEAAAPRLAMAQDPDSWSFGMLGPLRITLPDEPVITVPVSEAQAMLCMLILRHGRRVTYPELAQGMWEQPPTGPEAVRRIDLLAAEVLRRLGPGTVAALPDGYALHVPGAFVDVLHCEDLLSGASGAPGEQDAGSRRAEIRRALDLWYGPPLDGIPGPAAEATRARVHALRLSLRTAGAELDLELGHLAGATTDLEVLVRDHPDQVHLRRLHMLALRGQGRIAEAIASYESYAELRERDGDPIDAALEVLYRELLSASSASRGSDDHALTLLRELVRAATVRVHHPASGYDLDESATFIASGFFAAPNWVVTCAHVASRAVGNDVTVVYESAPDRSTSVVRGTVAAILPELALVRLTEPVQHECAYLSERPTVLRPGDWMFYAGWAETDGQVYRQDGSLAVRGSIAGRSGAARVHLADADLPHGLSGGPVIDPVRGEVVGVLTTRPDHVRGGTCVGISELRALPVSAVDSEHADLYQAVFHAHDRYHRTRQRQPDITRPTWAELQNQLGARPGRMLTPYERTELLGLLADLPPPVSTRSLVDILASVQERRTPTALPAPRGWRDGLGVLYESTRRREAVLEFAMQAMSTDRAGDGPRTSGAEEALWAWVMQAAQPLGAAYRERLAQQRVERLRFARSTQASWPGPGYRTGSGPQQPTRAGARSPGRILLELTGRGFEPGRVDWRIALLDTTRDEVLPLAEGSRTSLESLAPTLVAPLAEAFRRFDEPGHPATLEIATPARLLDLPVDAWRLVPSDDRPLGATRPIVTRCADALLDEDSELAEERLARWRALHTREPVPELLDCADGIAMPLREVESLRALPPTTIPVLCGRSHGYAEETDALGRLLLAGFTIVLWRRHSRFTDADCGEYHRGIRQTVASIRGVAELPQALLDMRARTAAGDPDVRWSDGLMLMYDDPTRPLPGAGDLLEAP